MIEKSARGVWIMPICDAGGFCAGPTASNSKAKGDFRSPSTPH